MSTHRHAPTRHRLTAGAAILLHIGIAWFPLGASGLVAPPWFLVLLAVVWIAGAVTIARLVRSAPGRALLVPLLVVALWAAGITAGEQLLGWSA